MFVLVNIYGEPINDVEFANKEDAAKAAAAEWAKGWEVYVLPLVLRDRGVKAVVPA